MAKTYNRLEIDVNKKPTDIITAVQADSNSRYLDVSLFNNGVPLDLTGHEVKIFMAKPEESGEIWNDGVITNAKEGRCEFLMTTEALARMGHLQAQISVWKDNTEILSTQIFEINVTKTLLGNSSVESSNEYGTLVLLFQNLYEAYALMTDMVSSFGKKGAVADARNVTTFWQGVEYLAKYMDTDLKGLIEKALANASVQGVLDLIGTSGDSGNTTVMGKENQIIKMTERVCAEAQSGNVKLCTASSNVLCTVISSERQFVGSKATDAKNNVWIFFNQKIAGEVRITTSIRATSGAVSTSYTVKPQYVIYGAATRGANTNNNSYADITNYNGTSYKTFTIDIPVLPTDVAINIRFDSDNYSSNNIYHCNLLTVCGTLAQASGMYSC